MVPRLSVIYARRHSSGRSSFAIAAMRGACFALIAILITSIAGLARPQQSVYGRASTPLATLAPHGEKTPPFPIETPTEPGTVPQPATPTLVPTALPTEPPTATPPETATVAPTPTPAPTEVAPQLFISEFMANPEAVGDAEGEWIELFNADGIAINLRDWILADLGSNRHVIDADLMIAPGQYLVLGRNADLALNGGIPVDYVYAGFDLANGEDEILLLAPDEREVDRVTWSDGSPAGASQERTGFASGAPWVTAWQAWPGSAGDLGSPGAAYAPNPNPDPPTPVPQPTAPGATPPPAQPDCTTVTAPPDVRIYLSEVLANPVAVGDSAGEWLELYNGGNSAVNLRCWILSDFGSDSHTIGDDLWIEAGAYRVLARNGNAAENGGVTAAYVYSGFSLGNDDDEVRLLRPGGEQVDLVRWGSGQSQVIASGASLERGSFESDATWITAWRAWPGSAGDFGSPGTAYVPNPNPVPTDPPVAPTVAPPPTVEPPPDIPPITGPLPKIYFSEFLADPDAVNDAAGEWIELFNGDSAPVNLRGWRIVDLGTDGHTIRADLMIQPGQYLVLGRNGVSSENGGVNVAYVYSSLSLSNGDDELVLIAPDEREVDRVIWSDGGLDTTRGASLERTGFDGAGWATAWQAWPGSAGDFGSPGAAYVPDPYPDPGPPPGPEPTAPPPPDVPPITGPLPKIYLSEFLANPDAVNDAAGEWIELFNGDSAPVNLRGWRIADLGTDGHTIRADLTIQPGQYLVLGRNDVRSENGGVDVAYVYSSLSLSNGDDELVLIAPGEREADRVIWGDGGLDTTKGASLERTSFDGAGWATAWQAWPGSAGDFGSPGAAYVPDPNPNPDPPGNPTTTPAPTAAPPDVPPITGDPPRLFISEFLANPSAVSDSVGEWVELHNDDTVAINLLGWQLRDEDDDSYTISENLYILPTQYLVLARNGDPTINGSVDVDHIYVGLSLANDNDELLLVGPGNVLVDQVRWGQDRGLTAAAGAALERAGFDQPPAWVTAYAPWPGSAGDYGSPGAAYLPPPDAPAPSATPPPATLTPPPDGGDLPRLVISEFLANPDAVGDNDGEWFELHNADTRSVTLRGWQITDLGSDRFVIDDDLTLAQGEFIVFGRNVDPAINGGAPVNVQVTGINLANGADELVLLAPEGQEVDRVLWGDGGINAPRGASLQRTLGDGPVKWFASAQPWPGSAGDLGTPGQGPDASPPPDGTPTPPPGTTATPTLPPTDPDAVWPAASGSFPLYIEEVAFRSSDEEFVAISNRHDVAVSLAGWSIGDAERPGDGEGIYALPDEATLAPGAIFVIARNGAAFVQRYGRAPDAQIEETEPGVPVLIRRTVLASGRWALSDSGDEVVLLNPAAELVDAVVYGSGDYAALARSGELRPPGNFSLQHVASSGQATDAASDQRQRFLFAPPDPFTRQRLPAPVNPPAIQLDDGYQAVWGSLGARSNFTPGFTAPPHYLAAAAGAIGLDFIALADAERVTSPPASPAVLTLPAWRWEDQNDNAAIIFAERSAMIDSGQALVNWLEKERAHALWLEGRIPAAARVSAMDGNSVSAPGGLRQLLSAWRESERPLLPGGSVNPPLPGRYIPAPRYTGLAVNGSDEESLADAISRSRGWLSSAPGLWLTLRAEEPDGSATWMGSVMEPANAVTLDIAYGDRGGAVAGLALWQNDRPLQQLDIPPADGRWSLTLPALPGNRYFVVATQTDGDFAVTAPIQVVGSANRSEVRLNEVMFAPRSDYNGDGVGDDNDEYIEIFNPGTTPADLSGWQLAHTWSDEVATRRFTFDPGSYLAGGERRVLWRADTGLYLDDLNEYVRLLAPDGREVDRVEWAELGGGSIGRDEDDGGWQQHTMASPGAVNAGILGTGTDLETTVGPAEGQAGGSPGSLALAKRYGLKRWVQFEAIVTAPPGLFNASMYVADPAPDGQTGGLGIQLYLRNGEFPPLEEGDRVLVSGWTTSFRGEMEVALDAPSQIWRVEGGTPLSPLAVQPAEVGESLEGRLVSFEGVVSGYQGDSIFLVDPAAPNAEPVRVTVRSSLPWKRPYVNEGERFSVVGIVGQFAKEKPWNGGYRVLVRYPEDLVEQ